MDNVLKDLRLALRPDRSRFTGGLQCEDSLWKFLVEPDVRVLREPVIASALVKALLHGNAAGGIDPECNQGKVIARAD